jgi:hypothetical protein
MSSISAGIASKHRILGFKRRNQSQYQSITASAAELYRQLSSTEQSFRFALNNKHSIASKQF